MLGFDPYDEGFLQKDWKCRSSQLSWWRSSRRDRADQKTTCLNLSELDQIKLLELDRRLPRNAVPGSAEAVMALLVYRETKSRKGGTQPTIHIGARMAKGSTAARFALRTADGEASGPANNS
ncbi:hypothetical protein ABID26_007015 [Mesorhizobium shonense]|uniref:Transposase n=1 Tax=Mesorhizobium shonense TaxID=1209948 RepID=A0ABV2I3V5_9HYPH